MIIILGLFIFSVIAALSYVIGIIIFWEAPYVGDYDISYVTSNLILSVLTSIPGKRGLTLDELNHIAGFLDGDGSVIAQIIRRKDYVLKFQIRLTVQFTQHTKRRWFLEHIKDLIDLLKIDLLKIGGKGKPGMGWIRNRGESEVSDYVITDTQDVLTVLRILEPFLVIKKKQAGLVIKIIESLPSVGHSQVAFLEVARLTDQVAQLNDSKTRTVTSKVVEDNFLTTPEGAARSVVQQVIDGVIEEANSK